MSLPWFRMYAEFAGDPVIQSLAFEDQRHYVVLLCLKCNGTLDREVSSELLERIVLRGLGLDPVAGAEAKRRLMEVGLVEKDWQPKGWDRRQFRSDTSTERVRTFRKRFKTVPETDQIQIQIKKQNRTDKAKTGRAIALPDWLPQEPWQAWLETRRRMKAPNTDRALKLAIGDLEKLRAEGQDPGGILDQSTKRGWRGLFPVSNSTGVPDYSGVAANIKD